MASAKKQSAARFEGRRVAVALNLHQCRRDQPKRKGEACFSIRDKPSSSSKVLAYVPEVWLEDVYFFVRPSGVEQIQASGVRNVCCFVVGTVIAKRAAKVTQKRGWIRVRLDVFEDGCFYRATTGACVRSAKYARIRGRELEAFGARGGEPIASARELPGPTANPTLRTYGPRRRSWRGEMGGQNFELASPAETAAAIAWVLDEHPGCVIIDGTDDWEAPPHVRPQLLCERFGITPVAWWHTGTSGLEHSGAVLSAQQWGRLRREYTREFGFRPDYCPGPLRPLGRGECGCWEGEALRVYDRALRRA